MQLAQNPRNNSVRQFRAWMNPATKVLSSIASAAVNGIAGLIFLTRIGILAHPNRVWADSHSSSPPAGPLAIAQQPPREFLTETRASASVKGCGVPPRSACAPCANYPR
jgi:hypothetical protein